MRAAFGLGLLLAAQVGEAAGWRDIEPGVSSRQDLLRRFGEPGRVQKSSGREVLVYPAWSIEGVRQAEFRVDLNTGLVEHINLAPGTPIDKRTVEESYGPACPGRNPNQPCYVRRLAGGTRPYYFYAKLGLGVFFGKTGDTVEWLVFGPVVKKKEPTPASSSTSSSSSSSTGTSSASSENSSTSSTSSGSSTSSASSTPAGGEDEFSSASSAFEPVESAPPPERKVEFSGKAVAENFTYVREQPLEKISGRNNVDVNLKAIGKAGKARAVGSLLARLDFSDPRRNRFDPDEIYVSGEGDIFRLAAGRMLVSWGTANLSNPTDVLNQQDRRDLLSMEKRGSWMVRAGALLGPLLVQGYYLPVPQQDLLPEVDGIGTDGTLFSSNPWIYGSLPQDQPLPLRYRLGGIDVPRASASNGQGAVRARVSFLGADLSATYAYLFDRLPTVTTQVEVEQALPPTYAEVTVELHYKRLHMAALDFERTFGNVRLAAEGALFKVARPNANDLENAFVSYVGGFDVRTPDFNDDHRLHFFLEYTETRAVEGSLRDDFAGRLRYPLRRNLLARVEYLAGDRWKAELSAASAVNRLDLILLPQVEYTIADGYKARLSGALLRGDSQGFFGPYKDNTRVEGSLEATF